MREPVLEGLPPSRLQLRREEKDRDRRVRRMLLILLLLLLLLFALALAFILIYGPSILETLRPGTVQSLFSIYGFDRPLSVSTDAQNNIYVSDTGHSKFYVFDSSGNYVRRIGTSQKHQRFYGVFGSRVDAGEKNIYVADWGRRAINVFTTGGKFVRRFPKDGVNVKKYGPLGLSPFSLDMYKDKIYITSADGVYVFSKKGRLLKRWAGRGQAMGRYDFPSGLAVDKKDGSIYVADQLNRRVVAMSPEGKIRWVLGKPDAAGNIVSFFGLPRGIAIDSEGRIYVTDTFHHQIVILTREGKLISVVGKRGTEDGNFNFPEGLVITKDNIIYLADRENDRIQALRINKFPAPSKTLLRKYRGSFIKPSG